MGKKWPVIRQAEVFWIQLSYHITENVDRLGVLLKLVEFKLWLILGLCDMDKKYISRFLDFFFDFDFNHDFDKQTCFISHLTCLAHLTCFCTSYLFLHILLVLHILFCTFLYSITHFTLYLFFYLYIYIYIYALVWCYFYIIFILCTVHWADLIWSTFHVWLYPV